MGRKTLVKLKRDAVTSKDVQRVLMLHLFDKGHSPITTNYTGFGHGECDMLSVSQSDYVYEYEIKISKSDFKRDFTKTNKHEALREGREPRKSRDGAIRFSIPNHFYFACPTDLIQLEDIPDYAGLIYMDGVNMKYVKKAPLLHNTKADASLMRRLAHNLTCKHIFNKTSVIVPVIYHKPVDQTEPFNLLSDLDIYENGTETNSNSIPIEGEKEGQGFQEVKPA